MQLVSLIKSQLQIPYTQTFFSGDSNSMGYGDGDGDYDSKQFLGDGASESNGGGGGVTDRASHVVALVLIFFNSVADQLYCCRHFDVTINNGNLLVTG